MEPKSRFLKFEKRNQRIILNGLLSICSDMHLLSGVSNKFKFTSDQKEDSLMSYVLKAIHFPLLHYF